MKGLVVRWYTLDSLSTFTMSQAHYYLHTLICGNEKAVE